jgi:ABC-type polar amino acid transport system ATPase subunit
MLKLSNWHKSFGNHQVLKDINLEVPTGEVLTIIGSSGSGKSTLLRSINFLEPADQGHIQINETKQDVQRMKQADILQLRRKTAMVFQNYALFSKKTALENVMESLLMVQKLPQAEAKEIATHYLEQVGMADRASYYPTHLSGGQQQRVGIARALAIDPAVILFDEPTSALDPELINGILDIIQNIAHNQTTMVLVTHEMDFAKEVSDQVSFLEKGVMVEHGTPQQIFDHPEHERTQAFIQGIQR